MLTREEGQSYMRRMRKNREKKGEVEGLY